MPVCQCDVSFIISIHRPYKLNRYLLITQDTTALNGNCTEVVAVAFTRKERLQIQVCHALKS